MDSEAGTSGNKAVGAIRFGKFELDLVEDVLRRGSERVNINPRTLQVLRLLVERRGEIVTKEEFFAKVWDGNLVEDNNLTVTITALRKALGDSAKDSRFIENVPRKGYRFVAEVSYEPSDPGAGDSVTEESSYSGRVELFSESRRFRKFGIGVLLAVLLFMVGAAAISYRSNIRSIRIGQPRFDSVAIIPFKAQSGSEYLADGITDALAERVSGMSGVRVIGRRYTAGYDLQSIDPGAAGRELRASAILTGSVSIENGSLTVVTELFDVAAGTRVWIRQFNGQTDDLVALQSELGDAVVEAVLPENRAQRSPRGSRGGTSDSEAYDLYIKGRYYWNKRTLPDIDRSIEHFRAAIDKDPTFAKAYIALANAYSTADLGRHGITNEERIGLARGAIERALEIDPDLGEAFSARAINRCFIDWDLKGAESDYRKALELSPNDPTVLHWYAELLSMLGRFDESWALYERAVAADPLSFPIRTDYALSFYYARNFDKAIELLNRARLLNPAYGRTYEFLSFAYREKGMYSDAIEALRKRFELSYRSGELTQDRYEIRMDTLDRMQSSLVSGSEGFWQGTRRDDENEPYYTAVAFSRLGDKNKAFEYLERALSERYSGMVWLKVTPELDDLRTDPRFDELLQRVGLP